MYVSLKYKEHWFVLSVLTCGTGFLVPLESGKKDCLPLQINHEEVAMVGLEAMERANSTLEDFCRSYFMFHGVDIDSPLMIFKYFPVLAFTESYIYQSYRFQCNGVEKLQLELGEISLSYYQEVNDPSGKKDCLPLQINHEEVAMVGLEAMERANSTLEDFLDGLNEKILSIPTEGDASLAKEFEKMNYQCWAGTFANMLEKDPFRPLLNVLELRGLLTDRIREEFRSGEEYWALERKLCCALTHKMEINKAKCTFFEVVLKVNDLHMEFLSVSEFLVEISDDLFDYEDDVLENNFNILRMFVKIYGPSTAPAMLAKNITDAEERYDNLLKTLDPQLSSKYQRRCEEATKEGGKVSGHPLGTWSIPPVIVNEDLYRSNCLNTE
ncbi:hypothetical protein GOBAR_AA33594 [Gossypium barbadense]|uniref:Uncharacterized protein n=1 Tax=Gossypium barbadense TaxID=3634 RepID=A0A2P5W7N4_GOSBA|nr:hypothetical protein GOBAR_AA33594 [Gossypium barbadense]